jgi:hypothetical protein
MLPTDILANTRAVPFQPFRLVLNSGKTYDVRHPEMVNVTTATLHYYHRDAPEVPGERWETVSLSLIQNIVHLDTAATRPTPGDGQ